MSNNKTITQALKQLRDDLMVWSNNRLDTKSDNTHIHSDYDDAINEINEEISIDYTKIQFETGSPSEDPTVDLNTYQTKTDGNLSTTDKTVVGAINELSREIIDEVTAREQAVAGLNERLGQQHVFVAEGSTQEEAEAWLETNGDKTKLYLMPDETFWQCKETTEVVEPGEITYTNVLPTAIDTDGSIYGGDYNENGVNDGYLTATRLSSSSGSTSSSDELMCATGFIPVKVGDKIRIKGAYPVTGITSYVISYTESKTKITNIYMQQDTVGKGPHVMSGDSPTGENWSTMNVDYYTFEEETIVIPLTAEKFGSDMAFIRISGHMNEDTIITINEPITESGVAYKNLLPLATDTDRKTIYGGDYNGDGGNDGYITGYRLSSSGSLSSASNMCASGFIPAKLNQTLRIKNTLPATTSTSSYVIAYNSSNTKTGNIGFNQSNGDWAISGSAIYTYEDGVLTIPLTSENGFGTDFNAIRFSAGTINENTIVTIDEEIKESTGTTTVVVEKWVSTGHGLLATNYDEIIATMNSIITAHTEEINALKQGVETSLTDDEKLALIRNWDVPIYDGNIPLFLLETEKATMENAENTPDAVYAMYDSLMAKYPNYITKTDLGICSDGVNHVYRYDFKEQEPYHSGNYQWSETKTKAIIVSGIHYEHTGIYSLYYALEEIAENPKLFDLRRNTHFIVIPVINPYCIIRNNYNASQGVLNANGVQIHRNFEVGFIYPGEKGYVEFGGRNHGGTAPLSEMETQCLDNIFKENTDSAFFLTCHNFDVDSTYGISFIWPSSATKYMCNMGFRLIDKMSVAWLDKYADELADGIASYKTNAISDNHIRFGHAHVSSTDGTETRQATKYGIQGTNVEVSCAFWAHGTKENVETSNSSFTLSRGAETYINFLLMACGLYDYKDKKEYYKEN